MLGANVALNAFDNVGAQDAAVGREPSSMTLPNIDYWRVGNIGGVAVDSSGLGQAVSTRSSCIAASVDSGSN
jgi:hypothetical protein